MLERPIVILSAWASGSPLIAGFLGECGGYLCPPFAKSSLPNRPRTYESEMYRGLVSATVNEYSFDYKVDPVIFRNGFKSWFTQQIEAAKANGSSKIILNHPLSAFLLDEICQVVDPVFIVVTRPLEKIEQTRTRQGLEASHGKDGAKIIYERIYDYLHETEKVFLAFAFRNFAASDELRYQVLDFCGLDVSDARATLAFQTVFPKA